MAARASRKTREIDQYDHKGQTRLNNPPVGLVTPETDKLNGKTRYDYDPHLDPQLTWAGKAEHTSFEVPRVSLHVHERIDPRTIIEALRHRSASARQMSLFEFSDENPPLREAIEFYKHKHNWSNRLIAGDSLLVMNSLLEKEGMAGKVQMIFIDPPYGIRYGSNFQPFISNRTVVDGKDEDLTQEPEMIKAFRDTWELGVHSYLTYLRDRLLLSHRLLGASGSIFVQISDENLHHVREVLDEVFGAANFVSVIAFQKTSGPNQSRAVSTVCDFLVHYAKEKKLLKLKHLFTAKRLGGPGTAEFRNVELPNGDVRRITDEEYTNPDLLPKGARVFATTPIVSAGYSEKGSADIPLKWKGGTVLLSCGPRRHWTVGVDGTRALWEKGRLLRQEGLRIFKSYLDDFPYSPLTNMWTDTRGETDMQYVVQTSRAVVQRCVLMTTDPGDLVFDSTCGSGTTAVVAEEWGRRWATCDTSRVALAIARTRLMTSIFRYYKLKQPELGVSGDFVLSEVPHPTIGSIARGEKAKSERLVDRPEIDVSRIRVAGPFTIEAVPAPAVRPLGVRLAEREEPEDSSISRQGETLRQEEWRAELLKTGIRGKGGQMIEFTRVEPLPATRFIHADAEIRGPKRERAVVSFGPDYAPLASRQAELAIGEAQKLVPRPTLVVFAAFQFDPEAAKGIDETSWPGGVLLKVQMNPDLFTEDLKKKRASNQSFWLIGQPDLKVSKVKEGKEKGKLLLEVCGFDYYNIKTGTVESGGTDKIALWLLDTDYDGRSLFPRQVFLPLAGEKEGWSRLAKSLRGEISEEAAEAYVGTVSLPFTPGKNKRLAVKIIDDRGIESLKVIEVD